MNYRHHFHAGNFADVMKHAILLALIDAMRAKGPLRVIETHAGAGLYDLQGDFSARGREATGGIDRIMEATVASAPLAALVDAVVRENPQGGTRFYPGSPALALGALRQHGDRYLGYELRPDDFESLQTLLRMRTGGLGGGSASRGAGQTEVPNSPLATASKADGYAALPSLVTVGDLILIDPPFERSDDYDRAIEAARLSIERGAVLAIWVPIKDLETFDGFVRRLEYLKPDSLVTAEVRLRPLSNPMKLNGCAMVLIQAPAVDAAAEEICQTVAKHCGEAGARGNVERIVD